MRKRNPGEEPIDLKLVEHVAKAIRPVEELEEEKQRERDRLNLPDEDDASTYYIYDRGKTMVWKPK